MIKKYDCSEYETYEELDGEYFRVKDIKAIFDKFPLNDFYPDGYHRAFELLRKQILGE